MRYWTAMERATQVQHYSGDGATDKKENFFMKFLETRARKIEPKLCNSSHVILFMVDPSDEDLQSLQNALVVPASPELTGLHSVAICSPHVASTLYGAMKDIQEDETQWNHKRGTYDVDGIQIVRDGVLHREVEFYNCMGCKDVMKHAAKLCLPGWVGCNVMPFPESAEMLLPPEELYVTPLKTIDSDFQHYFSIPELTTHESVTKENLSEFTGRSERSQRAAVTSAKKRHACKHCVFSTKPSSKRKLPKCHREYVNLTSVSGNGYICDGLILEKELPKLTPEQRLETFIYGRSIRPWIFHDIVSAHELFTLDFEESPDTPHTKKLNDIHRYAYTKKSAFWERGLDPEFITFPLSERDYVGIYAIKQRVQAPHTYAVKKSYLLKRWKDDTKFDPNVQYDPHEFLVYSINENLRTKNAPLQIKAGFGYTYYDMVGANLARLVNYIGCQKPNYHVTSISKSKRYTASTYGSAPVLAACHFPREFWRPDNLLTSTGETLQGRTHFIMRCNEIETLKKVDKVLSKAEEDLLAVPVQTAVTSM